VTIKTKTILIVANLALATSCSYTKDKKVKYAVSAEKRIKGNVQYIKETGYTCDSAGNIIEMEDCCIGRDEFNEDGNIVRQQITDKSGKPVMDIKITLKKNGLRETLTVSKEGKTISFVQNYFDDQGKYASQIIRDSANAIQKYYIIEKINDYGQWVKFSEYNKDSALVMKENSVFENSMLLKAWQTDKNGETLATYDFKFDDKDNLIEIIIVEFTETGEKKTITRYTYDEFDGNGNWVKRTSWNEKGKAFKVEQREFIYRKQNQNNL
jgi:hypothetical protein